MTVRITFSDKRQNILVNPPGIGTLIPFQKDDVIKIILEFKSNTTEKGIIWMNPTTNEIKVDIHQKYQFKYDLISNFIAQINQKLIFSKTYRIIYLIDKAEKDAKLEFKYNDKMKIGNNMLLDNPSKICHDNVCRSHITTYDIKKGQSYKIYIDIVFISNDNFSSKHNNLAYFFSYYLPNYSFSFIYEEEEKDDDKNKKKFIDLNDLSNVHITGIIILTILLIGGIGLCIFFICRKNSKLNIDKNNNKNILELEVINEENIEDDIAHIAF